MAELLAPIADRKAEAPALVDETGITTWAAFDERVNRLVHLLRSHGLAEGDVFACLYPNRREYYEAFLAAAHAGLRLVPVNWHWVADELAYVLDNSEAKVLLADARYADLVVEGSAGATGLRAKLAVAGTIEGFDDYEAALGSAVAGEPEGQVLGGPMFYTSGTTGRPKGVRSGVFGGAMPPGVFALMAAGFTQSAAAPVDGVTLLDGPLYHSAQWAFSVFPLVNGNATVIRHKFDAAETLRAIDEHQVTNVHLVPTQFIRLLRLPDDVQAAFDGSSLRIVWHGAAPCPPEVKRQMVAWWGPKIVEYYGGTEAGIVSYVSSEEWLARPGTLGKPLPNMEVMVVGDDGEHLGPNQVGTLYFRNTMGLDFEYHRDPDKTAKAHLEPGVYTLGDMGELDDDGYLYLRDRKIDMIISGGVNIYPAEVEGVLVTHPAVRDAAVFGIPDDEFGEQVKAAVELHDGYTADDALVAEILAYCRTKLAGYKVPKSVDVEAALPRYPTGKLYKRLLRDPYWEGVGRSI
jgi:long-chain acyl-CoA synthetase